ncbi:MAG: oligoendopeptidase F [Clostridium sp.]
MFEVQELKRREQVEERYKWKLEKMYDSYESWEADFLILKDKAAEMKNFAGKLHKAHELKEFFDKYCEVGILLDKLSVYANMKSDEDTTKTESQVIKSKIDAYSSQYNSEISFLVPELLSIENLNLSKLVEEEPGLELYVKHIESILEAKPHTLSKEEESILASVEDCLNAPSNIFGMLSNADMRFPCINDSNGNMVELTEGNYSQFIKSPDPSVRKAAFDTLYSTYEKFKNTFATTLISQTKNFIFNSKVRKYDSALEYALKPNNIPRVVYENVVNTITNNIGSLHRYVSLKKKVLGLKEMHMYDLYVPLVKNHDNKSTESIDFESAIEMVLKGLKPLGKEYLSIFSKGIESGWVDVLETKGKKGGNYSWGSYTSMPYVLLNYGYGLSDVSMFAHEMGHSVHSYYSKQNQPYIYSNYSLFCAEVASITNECLVIHDLIQRESDKNKRLKLINQQLEGIRTTVFRQAMFAEFELITHSTLEKGESLSAEKLCKIYYELNVKYFGPDIIVDEVIGLEWARILHFYGLNFYVYQYTTGFAAGNSFAKLILENGQEAVDKYLNFLKGGCTDKPIDILKKAGVDMTSPKPLQDTIEKFNLLLDILEKELL